MSVKDVAELGEECSLLSGPRTQRPICVHVGTPGPGQISCSCFLLRHHNTATELQAALLPHPQESWALGLVPTGCPLSTASNASLPAHLAPGESRISTACFSLPSFTALSLVFPFSHPPRHACEWQIQGDLDPADHQGAKPGRLRDDQLGGVQPWCRVTLENTFFRRCSSSCPGPPPRSLGNRARDILSQTELLPELSREPAWRQGQEARDRNLAPGVLVAAA